MSLKMLLARRCAVTTPEPPPLTHLWAHCYPFGSKLVAGTSAELTLTAITLAGLETWG